MIDLRMNEDAIDDGILGVVRVLRAAGVDTYSSCQGGGYQMGHGYLLPTVCFNGDDAEGERAERVATSAGYQVRQVSRTWYTRDGERCGPFWEMQFVMGAACRAPLDSAPPAQPTGDFEARVEAADAAFVAMGGVPVWRPGLEAALRAADAIAPPPPARGAFDRGYRKGLAARPSPALPAEVAALVERARQAIFMSNTGWGVEAMTAATLVRDLAALGEPQQEKRE